MTSPPPDFFPNRLLQHFDSQREGNRQNQEPDAPYPGRNEGDGCREEAAARSPTEMQNRQIIRTFLVFDVKSAIADNGLKKSQIVQALCDWTAAPSI